MTEFEPYIYWYPYCPLRGNCIYKGFACKRYKPCTWLTYELKMCELRGIKVANIPKRTVHE